MAASFKHDLLSVFGRRLRTAREHAGLPQDKLGVLIGLEESSSSARISRYETGTHEPPYKTALQLAQALDIPVAYLYCDEDSLADILLQAHRLSISDRRSLLLSLL